MTNSNAKARQLGDDVLGDAVAEVFLLRSPLMLVKGSTAIEGFGGDGFDCVVVAASPRAS